MGFLDRLKAEAEELEERLTKLNAFIEGEAKKVVRDNHFHMLKEQSMHMHRYLHVLKMRLKDLTPLHQHQAAEPEVDEDVGLDEYMKDEHLADEDLMRPDPKALGEAVRQIEAEGEQGGAEQTSKPTESKPTETPASVFAPTSSKPSAKEDVPGKTDGQPGE